MSKPQWATTIRQLALAQLFLEYAQSKGWQLDLATGEFYHPSYDKHTKELVADWVAVDRDARSYLLRLQRQALHRIPEKGSLRGTFSAISRDIFFDKQPQWYLESLGISGLTFKPFAKVRIASSFVRLLVDIAEYLKPLSKNKRRKFARYGKGLPVPVQREVEQACNRAIAHYLSK